MHRHAFGMHADYSDSDSDSGSDAQSGSGSDTEDGPSSGNDSDVGDTGNEGAGKRGTFSLREPPAPSYAFRHMQEYLEPYRAMTYSLRRGFFEGSGSGNDDGDGDEKQGHETAGEDGSAYGMTPFSRKATADDAHAAPASQKGTYIVVGLNSCGFTAKATEALTKRNCTFKYRDASGPGILDIAKMFVPSMQASDNKVTMPQVWYMVGNVITYVGGCTELLKWLDEHHA